MPAAKSRTTWLSSMATGYGWLPASYCQAMESPMQVIEFIRSRMRMSHVYQPLLIRALVRAGGSATLRQLATALLVEDESQLLYYEDRIKKMPLPVLRKHGVVRRE